MVSINKFLKSLEMIYGPYSYEIAYFPQDNTFLIEWVNTNQIHRLLFKRKFFNWRAYTADTTVTNKRKL